MYPGVKNPDPGRLPAPTFPQTTAGSGSCARKLLSRVGFAGDTRFGLVVEVQKQPPGVFVGIRQREKRGFGGPPGSPSGQRLRAETRTMRLPSRAPARRFHERLPAHLNVSGLRPDRPAHRRCSSRRPHGYPARANTDHTSGMRGNPATAVLCATAKFEASPVLFAMSSSLIDRSPHALLCSSSSRVRQLKFGPCRNSCAGRPVRVTQPRTGPSNSACTREKWIGTRASRNLEFSLRRTPSGEWQPGVRMTHDDNVGSHAAAQCTVRRIALGEVGPATTSSRNRLSLRNHRCASNLAKGFARPMLSARRLGRTCRMVPPGRSAPRLERGSTP